MPYFAGETRPFLVLLLVDHARQRAQRVRHAGAGRRRKDERRLFGGACEPRGLSFQLLRRQRIGLVERDHLGLLAEPLAIRFKLRAHGLVGRARMLGRAVDEMQEHAAALDVAEETVAESRAFMRPLDQAWNIREYELAAVDLDHAELGMQRREGVRPCRRARPPPADLYR